MPNPYFQFKQFTIYQDRCAMKVTTDGCLFGAWVARQVAGLGAQKALDIGAGTGLLSLMVAQKSSLWLDAVELDEMAAGQALENIHKSPWPNRIQVVQMSIQDFVPPEKYPVIFSNPPFYENELPSPKDLRSLAHHGNGLRLQELLQHIHRLLHPEGTAFLLFAAKRENELERELSQAGFYVHQKVVVHPSTKHPPFRLMWSIKKIPAEQIAVNDFYIKGTEGNHTAAFVQLLQEYYLFL